MDRCAMRMCSRTCHAEYGNPLTTTPRRSIGNSCMTFSNLAWEWPPRRRAFISFRVDLDKAPSAPCTLFTHGPRLSDVRILEACCLNASGIRSSKRIPEA
jgi:hypothetical protein